MTIHAVFFGSRTWRDLGRISQAIDDLILGGDGSLVVITGGAKGADRLADREMRRRGFLPIVEPARWSEHDREGATPVRCSCPPGADRCRAAGVRRNQLMIDRHLLPALDRGEQIAARGFRAAGASPGTDDMVARLKAANVTGRLFHERPPVAAG